MSAIQLGYSLTKSSQFVCLAYHNATEELTINWVS